MPEQAIDLYRVITMNNLDVQTIAPAHGFGPKPFDNLKKAIGLDRRDARLITTIDSGIPWPTQ